MSNRVAQAERGPDLAQKYFVMWRIDIADIRSETEHQRAIARPAYTVRTSMRPASYDV